METIMKNRLSKLACSITSGICVLSATFALVTPSNSYAQQLEQTGRSTSLNAVKGKRVIFIPISQGFDLNQAWVAVWKRYAAQYGFKLDIRDPNMDTASGIRAITGAIAEKPDLLIVQNPDVQTYARQLKQAQDAGIRVLQVNMQSATQTDSYVGNDWVEMGRLEAEELARTCTAKGKSGKIVWLAGVETGAANVYMRQGINEVLAKYPTLKLVSDQPANYDSEKARAITETLLKQHPDLCGVMGIWDNAEVGAGAAIAAAGKTGQVTVVTNGAGSKSSCDNIRKGLLTVIYDFNAPLQGEIAAHEILSLLQTKVPAGQNKITFFNPIMRVDKDNMNDLTCWTPHTIQ